MNLLHNYGGKSVWPINLLLSALKCIIQVLQTSTDPCRQFAVSFKAAYFGQDQTCCIQFGIQQRKVDSTK